MINFDVVVESNLWRKKIKNPKFYLEKKIKKINSLLPTKRSFFFSILLTGNNKMKSLNRKFSKKKFYLGDIAINYAIINERSKKTNFSLEFDKMWIHGYLHLLGYDHKKDIDHKKMKKVEDKILALCS